ncbi:MAG: autotransporter-associated beta strand repeat-containing protein [Akkermansiaceae bacterium]|nr:autotransporter-associated beta strand repeat-containing protein [Akkermansiaceae bacterium]
MKYQISPILLGSIFAVFANQRSFADVYTWNGGPGTWDTVTANWTGAGMIWPATSTTDDDAIFGGTAGAVTIATGGVTANDISFNSNGYSVGGAGLILNGVTPTLTAGTGVDATISSVISGASGLVKAGAGNITLSGANTFTGGSTISAGSLVIQNNAALGADGSAITVNAGAALNLGGSLGANTLNLGTRVFTVSGSGIGGTGVLTNTGTNSQNAAISKVVLGADSTFGGTQRWDFRNNTPTLNLAGFNLTKTGTNYVSLVGVAVTPGVGNITVNQGEFNLALNTNLNGASSNSITVNNGATFSLWGSTISHPWTLNLADGSTFRGESSSAAANNVWAGPVGITGNVTLRADGQFQINGNISGTGNITKTLGSTVTLRGSNTFSGSTTVSTGTLVLDYLTNDTSKLDDLSALQLGGGTLSLTGGLHNEVVGSTVLAASSHSTIQSTHGGVIHLNAITRNAAASLNFASNAIATTDNLNDATGILGTWATVGDFWATNASNGLDGSITALTDYVFSFDNLDNASLYQNKHVVVDSVQAPDAAIASHSFIFNTAAANSLTLQGSNSLTTGGILVSGTVGANATAISGGTITGPSNGDLTINQRNAAATGAFTLGSAVVDNGTTGIQKLGSGTAILTGANTYSGTTSIGAGQLQINNAGALGSSTSISTSGTGGAALVLNDGVTAGSGKTITINGGGAAEFFGALSTNGSATWEGSVIIGAPTSARIGTLTAGTLTVSGNISEPSGVPSALLTRANTGGSVLLSGNNTHTGGTQVVVGGLRMGSATALGTGPLTLGGGTNPNSFSSDSTTPRTIANALVFNGTTTHGLGDATNNGKLTFTGPVTLGNASRTLGVNSTVEISNAIGATASVNLVKIGAADLILSAPNTYTGSTQINGGTLVVAHKDALATSSSVFPSTTAGSGVLRLATDTSAVINRIETSSSNPGTILSDRATPGDGINHVIPAGWFGANTYTFAAGPNVTGGTARITLNSANLTAGAASTAILNPTTAVMTIDGPVNIGLNNQAKTLRLDGASTGNLISGVVSNGLNTLSITKTGASTWELSGVNTYTGNTTVANGSLTLSGNRVAASGAFTVGNTAGFTGTLNISGNLPVGNVEFGVGTSASGAVGIINQTAGLVSFTAGNAVLIGRNTGGVSGTYNLSGGELRTYTSTTRGVMLGVNDGSTGNPINATFNLSGTGFLNNATGSLQIVRGDSTSSFHNSTYTQTGGTSSNGSLIIGGGINGANVVNAALGQNSVATVSITGGTFTTTTFNGLSRANNVVSTITIGGTADVTLPAFPTARGTGSLATLYFDGGTLKPSASSVAYLGGLTNAFVQDGGVRINTNSFDITVSQNLLEDSGSLGGGLTKDGSGILALTSTGNTYKGATTVNAGTLSLGDGTANSALDDASDVIVASGATLNLNFSAANVDVVDTLTINGVQKAAGVWGAPGSGAPNTDAQLSGTGYLQVTTGGAIDDYSTWANSFSPAIGLKTADDDGDGLTNFEEYAFGLNPQSGASSSPISQTLDASTGVFKYTRRATPATTGLVYTYESSTTLSGSWPSFSAVTATSNGASPVEEITVTLPPALLTNPSLFIRVRAEEP